MLNILYVDDEPGLLEIGKMFLEGREGFAVDTLTSASDALAIIPQKKYDAVISDYQMPVMNGIEFLKKVRASGNTIPFILFTGRGREEVVIEAINAGVDFYLQKGGDPTAQFAELSLKIRNAVSRRQAEIALLDSERRLSDIINFLPDATFAVDNKGTVIAWNRAIEKMTGFTAQEIIGKGNHEYSSRFYHEHRPALVDFVFETDEKISNQYSDIHRQEDTLSAETQFTKPDGNLVYLFVKASPLYDSKGEIIGAIEAIRDITNIKRAANEIRAANEQITASSKELRAQYDALAQGERRIRESEEKYRGMAERSSDLILVIDKGMSVTYVSPSSRSIIGYEPEELVGKTREFAAATIFSPSLSEFNAPLQAVMKGLPVEIREILIKKKDGSAAWVEMYALPVMRDGVFDGAQVSMRDITERRKLEDKKIRFGRIINDSINEIYTFDAETLRFIDVNRGACENLGYSRDELRAVTLLDIKSNLTRESFEKRVAPLRSGEAEKIVFSTEQKRKDGTLYPVEVHLQLSRTGTQPVFVAIILNITERRKAEEALKESEEKYRMLVEKANEAVTILQDSRTVYANPRMADLVGIPEKELLGMTFLDMVWPEDREMLQTRYLKRRAGEDVPDTYDFRMTGFGGNPRWIHISIAKIQWQGRPATLNIMTDITDRKLAEDALRGREELLRLFIDHAPVALAMLDKELRYIAASNRWRADYHLGDRDLIGHSTLEIFPELTEKSKDVLHRGLTGETVSGSDDKFERQNGSIQWLAWRVRPWFTTNHDVGGVIIFSEDITKRKTAELALQESEEKFRSFVENANEIVFSLTSDGIFSYVSPKWTELLGHDVCEIIGKSAVAIIHPDDVPRLNEFIQRTIMTGNKASGIEYRVQHKNGTWQWHSLSLSPVYDAGGRVIAVQGICHDITEQKNSVVALRRANRQLTLLTDVTRHDILNKVSTARGYLGIAEMKYGDPSQAEYMKKTEDAIAAIKSQIEFTKVYEDLGTHDPHWIDLDTVMPRLHVPATITLDADIQGIMLFADPMLEKVFFNLLDNSLRYGERVTEIRVSSHMSEASLVVVWEDNGTGVAADQKERIFERGFGKNTGMGLFLVREILSLTGITITENGEPGKGARFELTIPDGQYRLANPVKE